MFDIPIYGNRKNNLVYFTNTYKLLYKQTNFIFEIWPHRMHHMAHISKCLCHNRQTTKQCISNYCGEYFSINIEPKLIDAIII